MHTCVSACCFRRRDVQPPNEAGNRLRRSARTESATNLTANTSSFPRSGEKHLKTSKSCSFGRVQTAEHSIASNSTPSGNVCPLRRHHDIIPPSPGTAPRCIPRSQVQHVETVNSRLYSQSKASHRLLALQSLPPPSRPRRRTAPLPMPLPAPLLPRVLHHPSPVYVATPGLEISPRATSPATERQEHTP